MRIITTVEEMQTLARELRAAGSTIGCVPTMGYLHDGHASLIRAAAEHHGTVVTSIFVNPMQFAPTDDLSRYPRDFERDKIIAEAAGCAVIFAPTVDEMYPAGFATTISVGGVSAPFEGAHRPGHYDGVATVVAKLFVAIAPDEAYFGQKDYQQTLVVRRMVTDLGLPVKIHTMPTRRESDGLAMSSRNVYLSEEERAQAAALYRALSVGVSTIERGERQADAIVDAMHAVLSMIPGITIDYLAVADAATLSTHETYAAGQEVVLLLAVRIGTTRLIDNMLCTIGG